MSTKIILLILALSPDPLPDQDIHPVLVQAEAPSMELCVEAAKSAPGKILGDLQILGASCVVVECKGKQI